MKYKSELIHEILENRGHEFPDLHYQSECVESWIKECEGSYPKLCDYESEWLNYIVENPIGNFPYETVTANPTAVVHHVVPYAYKRAILKGNTLVNLQSMTSIAYQNSSDGIIVKENNRIICTSKTTTATNIRLNYAADANKTYTIKCKLFNNSSSDIKIADHSININDPIVTVPSGETSSINFKFKPHSASVNMGVLLFINHGSPRIIDEEVIIEDLIILEGDYTNQHISYFEGMQSVQMPVLTTSNDDGTKTIILTVNEGVALGSNGGVYDELDLLSGKLTQRIGEDNEVLAQEIVKTVDLTVVNQDGETLNKIKPIEGTMYVEVSGTPIPPTAVLEVPVEAITQNLNSFIGEE